MKLGRPQAALRYQYIFAQIEMEGRATGQIYLTNIPPYTNPNQVRNSIITCILPRDFRWFFTMIDHVINGQSKLDKVDFFYQNTEN